MTKIVSLTAENFKRLKAVHIEPDGNVVVISGRNAQGKSSVLDSIWAALAGAAGAKNLDRPIRDGEKHAEVTVELDDLTVTRRWTERGSTLTVTSKDGQRQAKPQQVLDALIGKLAFDPLAFATAKPADQRTMLLDVVGLADAVAELERQRKGVYDARTDVNRDVKRLQAQVQAAQVQPLPAGVTGLVDIATLSQQLQQALAARSQFDLLRNRLRDVDRDIEEVQRRLKQLQTEREVIIAEGVALSPTLETEAAIEGLQERISNAENINAAVRANEGRAALARELADAQAKSEHFTANIEEIDASKAALLAGAALPVVGLGVDEEGITLNGVPFTQASAAERLKVSVAMAMAMNPSVRVICIRDAALLDSNSMASLARFAAARDFQIWVERVDPQQGVGVVIEDGEVVA